MELKLTLPVPTSLNDLYINEYTWNPKKKMRVPSGRRILSKEGEKCKRELTQLTHKQMKDQNWDYEYTINNYIYMDTIIYFSRKGRDDNNIYKLLCDSLEKIVYENDSRVLIRTHKILFDTDNPHIDITLRPVTYRGIFKSEIYMNEFEDKCKGCKRYKRNCSILNKAKEGRIQEEINEEFICSKYNSIQ